MPTIVDTNGPEPFWYRCQRCGLYYGPPHHTVPCLESNSDRTCARLGIAIVDTPVFHAESIGETPNTQAERPATAEKDY